MNSANSQPESPPREDAAPVRRLLAFFAILPRSFEKNAHMMMLKHLSAHGWKSTVLTIAERPDAATEANSWYGVDVIRVRPKSKRWHACQSLYAARSKLARGEVSGTRRMPGAVLKTLDLPLRSATGLMSFPDRHRAAVDELIQVANTLHRHSPFDAVVSLYHPLSSHMAARKFAAQHEIPWTAFSQDFYSWPDELMTSLSAHGPNLLKRFREKRVLQSAQSVAAVNDNMAAYLRSLLDSVPVYTLDHCYDPTDFPPGEAEPSRADGVFRLVSVGLVAPVDEPALARFFHCVRELKDEGVIHGSRMRARFVGHGGEIVRRCAERAACLDVVEIVPPVSHAEAMLELKRANSLFFQQAPWGNRRRLAEYFASRKPILAFPEYPGAASAGMIEQYGAGRLARDDGDLKSALRTWISEFETAGNIGLTANEAFVEQFAAPGRAGELNMILESTLSQSAARGPARAGRNSSFRNRSRHPGKTRVLWLIKGLGLGGAEKLLCQSLPHLNRDEFEYEVGYFLPWKDTLVSTIEDHGIPVRCFNVTKSADPSAIWKVAQYLRQNHIDVLHAHSPWPGIAGRIAGRVCRTPVIAYTEHGLWARLNRFTRWTNGMTLAMNEVTIAVSEPVAASIPVPEGHQIVTIPSGIDAQVICPDATERSAVRAELGIPESHVVIGNIANFSPVKRHETLLEAFALFQKDVPNSTLVLVGQLRDREKWLEQIAAERGIKKDVIITGPRPDAVRIAQAFDVFALSSEFEGLPVSLLEAMALAKPVVCTNVGGIPDVVSDGIEGFLVPPDRPDLMAERFTTLARDPALRKQMGAAARERVSTDFDIRTMVSAIESTYRRLLEERGIATANHRVLGRP